jgi:hypothetical protein
MLNIVAVSYVLVYFNVFSVWNVLNIDILTNILKILRVIYVLANAWIWLGSIYIEINKLTHAGYL